MEDGKTQFVDFVEIYEDEAGEHRWKAKSNNGNVVADSGEGYKNRNDAREAAVKIFPDVEIRHKGEF